MHTAVHAQLYQQHFAGGLGADDDDEDADDGDADELARPEAKRQVPPRHPQHPLLQPGVACRCAAAGCQLLGRGSTNCRVSGACQGALLQRACSAACTAPIMTPLVTRILAQRLDTERLLRGRRSGAGHEGGPFSDSHCRRACCDEWASVFAC